MFTAQQLEELNEAVDLMFRVLHTVEVPDTDNQNITVRVFKDGYGQFIVNNSLDTILVGFDCPILADFTPNGDVKYVETDSNEH
ncbi:MAG: hypothetical protein KDH96_04010 [Candidatus Riesia sp.]|nr:hypothetical protein [Candidatus Riesia sp.]